MIYNRLTNIRINSHWFVLLSFFCFFYFLVNFVLTTNEFFPVHQDDYVFAGSGFQNMSLFIERPVIMNLAYFVAALGMLPSFILVSSIVVIFPVLVILFLENLFDIKYRWYTLILFAAITFGHVSAFENGKYLGSVGSLSGVFGVMTLLTMVLAYRKNQLKYVGMALIFYTLTCFSREDYLLPPMILIIALGVNTYFQFSIKLTYQNLLTYRRTIFVCSIFMLLVAFLSVLLSIKVASRFAHLINASVATDPYAVKLTIDSLLTSIHKLTFEFIPTTTFFSFLGFTILWFTHKDQRFELITLAFIVIALILPYAMIPNNLPSYRVVSWLPWFAAIGCIGIQAVLDKVKARLNSKILMLGIGLTAASSIYVLLQNLQYNPERNGITAWYAGQQVIQKNIIQTLSVNRNVITGANIVAIRGIEMLSPWGDNDAQFLRDKLGFKNKWLIFVSGSSLFNKINFIDDGTLRATDNRQYVLVAPISKMCELPNMLLISFDEKGVGDIQHTKQQCAH